MKIAAIIEARAEAQRFLERVKDLEGALRVPLETVSHGGRNIYNYPALTGALRRASMDLTRALAAMRRRG